MELIRAQSVVKRQGAGFKLGPVDLELRSGEVLGIIGKTGAGKTTLLKLIWGFLRPDQGSLSVFRTLPDRRPTRSVHIAVLRRLE